MNGNNSSQDDDESAEEVDAFDVGTVGTVSALSNSVIASAKSVDVILDKNDNNKDNDKGKEEVAEDAKTPPKARRTYYFPTMLSLSLFSYFGEFLRYILEELFGVACHEPEKSDWSDWAPCTTAPGTTEATGGAFFSDLPANVLGCFVMGFLVSGDADMLPVDLPMAFLSRDNRFQQWKITHLGLRTGFCGALTTFASWNTQMTIMLCGGDGTDLGYSQWVSVIWGYLVGWMIAMESFRVGRDCAHALSRRNNPDLAKEIDLLREKQELGQVLSVNRELPDFERRFLHSILMKEPAEEVTQRSNPKQLFRQRSSLIDIDGSVSFSLTTRPHSHQQSAATASGSRRISNYHTQLDCYGSDDYPEKYKDHIHHLQHWKDSTDKNRKPGAQYADELHEIERSVIVHGQEPSLDMLETIRDAGWNYEALKNWKGAANNSQEVDAAIEEVKRDGSGTEFLLHLMLFVISTGLLIWGAIDIIDNDGINDQIDHNYRTQMLSALFSPPGTILRWVLSKLNGRIQHKDWEWLPIGTLAANLTACCISVLMPAIELRADATPLANAFMGAIKTGFAGSLSTVSTFAAETVGLFRALPRYFWGYYYSFGSMVLGCIVGVVSYVWAIA